MQPYFFPYAGYFQLFAAANRFIFYDDVNYIRGGWINRNRFLMNGEAKFFLVPIADQSSFRKIKDTQIAEGPWREKMLKGFEFSYRRAKSYEPVRDLIEGVLATKSHLVGDFAKASVVAVAEYLGIETQVVGTSQGFENENLNGEERILDICDKAGAREYINLPGGRELYSAENFAARNIRLRFLRPALSQYPQGKNAFMPGLSIVDILMNNSQEDARRLIAMTEVE